VLLSFLFSIKILEKILYTFELQD